MLFKLSNLNSNLAPILGYLNQVGPDLFQQESLSLVTSTTRLEFKWRTLWMMNGGWNKTLKT